MEKIVLTPDPKIPLDIIYEDSDILVLNKQAGISVHPSVNEPEGTLANGLIARFPEIKNVGEDHLRPGIVHRLDKNTSGLLVVAKNQKTFEFLKNQWQKGEVEKKYLALVVGHLVKDKGRIEGYLARSKKDFRKRMALVKKLEDKIPDKKFAVTEYKVLKKFKDYSLVEVAPKTGRMHQIRVHLASFGNPVAGDKLYGKKQNLKDFPRQMLHAYFLSFALPNGRKLAFEVDLPPDIASILTQLEK